MVLQAEVLTKAAQITQQTAEQYQKMKDTMINLSTDAMSQSVTVQAALDWDIANPGVIDPQVVIEMQQFKDYMTTLAGILATVPPVPNV